MFTSFYYKNTSPLIILPTTTHKTRYGHDMKLNIIWIVGVVHFPGDIPSREFKITVYTPIEEVRETLQKLVPYDEGRKVEKIEYRSPSIDNEGNLQFMNRELKNGDDLRAMWSAYRSFQEKVSIELDATLSRTVDDIMRMLQRPPEYWFVMFDLFLTTKCIC